MTMVSREVAGAPVLISGVAGTLGHGTQWRSKTVNSMLSIATSESRSVRFLPPHTWADRGPCETACGRES